MPNALLLFKGGTKSEDYHDDMNFAYYKNWVRTQLVPNLPPNSVGLVDNASYHNKIDDTVPTSCSRKAVMEKWLTDNGIPYNSTMLKLQLYNLILQNKSKNKIFNIDKVFEETAHTVLRLPPYKPDLNPINMVWARGKDM